MNRLVLGLVALALVASLALPVASAGHEDGLTFVLSGQVHEEVSTPSPGVGSEPVNSPILTQVTEQHPDQGVVEEVSFETECRLWVADQPAQVDLSYGAQTIAYQLELIGEEENLQTVNVSVGSYDTDGDGFTAAGTAQLSDSAVRGPVNGEVEVDPFTIEDGEYSATRICVSAVNPGAMAVNTASGTSSTTYTSTDDDQYPTPELSSMVLSGVGALALIGMARFQRDE